MNSTVRRFVVAGVVFVMLPLLFAHQPYVLHVITVAAIWGLAAAGLNILAGMLVILDLGFVCYVGFGAYLDTVLAVRLGWPFAITFPFVIVFSSLLGAGLAWPLIRLRGHAASMITLGYGLVFYQLVNNADSLGGPNGIRTTGALTFGLISQNQTVTIIGISFPHQAVSYFFTMLIVVLLVSLNSQLGKLPLGRLWMAAGDDESLLPYFRLSSRAARLSAFMLAGGIGGAAGVLLARQMGYITPGSFTLTDSLILLTAVLLGGRGNALASALTAAGLILLGEYLRVVGEWRLVAYGAILVAAILYRQQGLWPAGIPRLRLPFLSTNTRNISDTLKSAPAMDPIISVENLTKRFGALTAVDAVDLSIKYGELVGLVGPNGSGKTVFLDTVTGRYAADEGTIAVCKQIIDCTKANPLVRSRARIARSFQVSRLFPRLSVAEHVLLPLLVSESNHKSLFWRYTRWLRPWSGTMINEALGLLALFGERLRARVNDSAATLSFANRRRLEIARALATKPRVLLLDEPSSGMNPEETSEFADDLSRLPVDALLISEHKFDLLEKVTDRVYCLDRGRIVAEGSLKTVLNSEEVKELFDYARKSHSPS